MICFNTAARIGSINVERIEMGTYLLQRCERLYQSLVSFSDIKMELTLTIPVTMQPQFQGPCLLLREVRRVRYLWFALH